MRVLLRAVGVVALLPVMAVAWHTPVSTGGVHLDAAAMERCVTALREHGRPPAEYVVDLFRRRDVVIIGEAHRVAQDALFVQELIPLVHRAGVTRLVIEFGDARSQPEADRLVAGVAFDRALARKLLYDFDPLWAYEEYFGLYEAAWRANRSLAPGQEPFRILLGTPGGDLESKERVMAGLVVDHVRAGGKALVYCGTHHAFTRYRQPMPFEALLPARPGRMGNLVHDALGDRAAFVQLHAPAAKRWAFFAWWAYRRPFLYPFGGVIDRAHAAIGSPVAFDTSLEPLASLEDTTSYYALHRGRLRLRDFADGYVILAPMAGRRTVRAFDDAASPAEMEHLRARYAGTRRERLVADAESYRALVARDGLRPETVHGLIDASGFEQPSWIPNVSLFWILGAGLAGGWMAFRLRGSTGRRRRSSE